MDSRKRVRAACMLPSVTDSKTASFGRAGNKKPPADGAGGGLDAAGWQRCLRQAGHSARIGDVNSHRARRRGFPAHRRGVRIGAGSVHDVDCSRAEKECVRQDCAQQSIAFIAASMIHDELDG